MNLRSAMALCAVVAGASSLTLCQPPTPRIAHGDGRAYAVVTLTRAVSKGSLPAFDRVKQAVRMYNPDSLPSLDSMR